MEKSNTSKIRLIYLPAILMAVFLSASSILFHQAQNILLVTLKSVPAINTLKTLVVFTQIIFVLTLLLVSGYKSFEKVFRGTLFVSIGIIAFLTSLVFFQETLQLNGTVETLKNSLPSFAVRTFEPIIENWPSSLLYISLNLFHFNLFSLLIWGFINRFTSTSEGIKNYIPLAFIINFTPELVGALVTYLSLLFIEVSNRSLIALILPAIALMIGATIVFNRFWKRIPDNFFISAESGIEQKKNRFPFLASAYLLAGSVMIGNILNIFFRSQVKMQFPDPISYTNFMASYSISAGSSSIIMSILWAILGSWLILKRGWRTTALVGSISVLVGGLVFLGFSFENQSVSLLSHGIMVGLLKGTLAALFFPLVQLIYLYMPAKVRFRTKVLTEMVLSPLIKGIPSIVMPGLFIVFGSISAVTIYGKIFILILLILFVAASAIIGRRYNSFSKP